jgi:glycosyltransferase involved in cell wall biosynthesis
MSDRVDLPVDSSTPTNATKAPAVLTHRFLANPTVTIGIPAYNAEQFLSQSIECFLAQTFGDIEIIVSDNASTDRTRAIVLDYAARDPRVRYEPTNVNLGMTRNYNRLVGLARAPYFRWSAADDLSGPTSVARCLEVLQREPSVVLAYPRTTLIDAQGNVLRDYDDNLHLVDERPSQRFDQYLERIGLCNILYGLMRTGELRRTRLMPSFIGADIVFQGELALRGKIWEVPERLFLRRFHIAASSGMNLDQLAVYYNPGTSDRLFMRHWRHLAEHTKSVLRVPLSPRERLRSLRILARNARRSRDNFVEELAMLARHWFRKR